MCVCVCVCVGGGVSLVQDNSYLLYSQLTSFSVSTNIILILLTYYFTDSFSLRFQNRKYISNLVFTSIQSLRLYHGEVWNKEPVKNIMILIYNPSKTVLSKRVY